MFPSDLFRQHCATAHYVMLLDQLEDQAKATAQYLLCRFLQLEQLLDFG
jgi:hypothetical protein